MVGFPFAFSWTLPFASEYGWFPLLVLKGIYPYFFPPSGLKQMKGNPRSELTLEEDCAEAASASCGRIVVAGGYDAKASENGRRRMRGRALLSFGAFCFEGC